jgi:hypothetical protein
MYPIILPGFYKGLNSRLPAVFIVALAYKKIHTTKSYDIISQTTHSSHRSMQAP